MSKLKEEREIENHLNMIPFDVFHEFQSTLKRVGSISEWKTFVSNFRDAWGLTTVEAIVATRYNIKGSENIVCPNCKVEYCADHKMIVFDSTGHAKFDCSEGCGKEMVIRRNNFITYTTWNCGK